MGVVAAGAVPLSVPAEMQVTQTARYRQMLADYQLLAREQLICGTQVHVGVDDRDESVVVANRVAPYLPTLLALSASSPFWSDGSDTGYSSGRTLVWQRWPTTGLAAPVASAAEYDQLVADLVASGVITDAGMVYFDVRPASRRADAGIAGVRQLPVGRHHRADRRAVPGIGGTRGRRRCGRASPPSRSRRRWAGRRCGARRAPGWRATWSTSTGPAAGPRPTSSPTWCGRCARSWRRRGTGRWSVELARQVLIAGTSAARQRRALRRRGRLTDVVDQLIAETAGRWPNAAAAVGEDPTLLFGYQPDSEYDPSRRGAPSAIDEAVDPAGRPRPRYEKILHAVADLGVAALRSREGGIEQEQRADNITFRVSGQSRAQLFPRRPDAARGRCRRVGKPDGRVWGSGRER